MKRRNDGADALTAKCQHGPEAPPDTADGLPRQRWKRYGNAGRGTAEAFTITRAERSGQNACPCHHRRPVRRVRVRELYRPRHLGWGGNGCRRRIIKITALISSIGIAISAVAVVLGFYANVAVAFCLGWEVSNVDCGLPFNNAVVFTLIVGGAPPVVAATAARIGDIIDPLRALGTPAPPHPSDGTG